MLFREGGKIASFNRGDPLLFSVCPHLGILGARPPREQEANQHQLLLQPAADRLERGSFLKNSKESIFRFYGPPRESG